MFLLLLSSSRIRITAGISFDLPFLPFQLELGRFDDRVFRHDDNDDRPVVPGVGDGAALAAPGD